MIRFDSIRFDSAVSKLESNITMSKRQKTTL